MLTPEQRVEAQQRKAYWKRHAFSTCIVLLVVVALSSIAYPLPPWLVLACLAGGVTIYLGEVAADRHHNHVALGLIIAGLLVFLVAVLEADVLEGPLLWVQGIASFVAGALAARVVHEKLPAA